MCRCIARTRAEADLTGRMFWRSTDDRRRTRVCRFCREGRRGSTRRVIAMVSSATPPDPPVDVAKVSTLHACSTHFVFAIINAPCQRVHLAGVAAGVLNMAKSGELERPVSESGRGQRMLRERVGWSSGASRPSRMSPLPKALFGSRGHASPWSMSAEASRMRDCEPRRYFHRHVPAGCRSHSDKHAGDTKGRGNIRSSWCCRETWSCAMPDQPATENCGNHSQSSGGKVETNRRRPVLQCQARRRRAPFLRLV